MSHEEEPPKWATDPQEHPGDHGGDEGGNQNGHSKGPVDFLHQDDGVLDSSKTNGDQETPLSIITRRGTNSSTEAQPVQNLKYPKVVFFIIGNEFCERFSYYGMRTVLFLFLTNSLKIDSTNATVLYHVFNMLCYFFPVIGAIISDSWLGKFKTIAYLSVVYALGNIVVSFASVTTIGIPSVPLTYLGLLLIAMGTGGIKPCVSSFGGDQFVVPQQAKQLSAFFSVFYFAINAGSLISTYLTPELRSIPCLGMETCFPASFGVPAILMIVSLVIFVVGKPGYKIIKPKGNVALEVSMCVGNALKNKIRSSEKKGYWLDYADSSKYSQQLRNDVKDLMKILVLFVPLPIFWALYDQQGSRWTDQANNMNGRIGGYVVKPDQMQVVNPILIMILLPLFNAVVYPLFARFGLLKRPLQKIAAGGLLGAVAFVISGLLQQQLEPNLPVELSSGFAQVRVFNSLPCDVTLKIGSDGQGFDLKSLGLWEKTDFAMTYDQDTQALHVSGTCASGDLTLDLIQKQSVSYQLYKDIGSQQVKLGGMYQDDLIKQAAPATRILYHFSDTKTHTVNIMSGKLQKVSASLSGNGVHEIIPLLDPDEYSIRVDGQDIQGSMFLDVGGVYTFLVSDLGESPSTPNVQGAILVVITANIVNLFWLLPQYIVISVAEVMLSVTGYDFSYTQAPNSLKSVISSAWLLTDAVGNIIIIFLTEAKIFESEANEYFMYAGLMVAVMIIFIWLAMRYQYVDPPSSDADPSSTDLSHFSSDLDALDDTKKALSQNGNHSKTTPEKMFPSQTTITSSLPSLHENSSTL